MRAIAAIERSIASARPIPPRRYPWDDSSVAFAIGVSASLIAAMSAAEGAEGTALLSIAVRTVESPAVPSEPAALAGVVASTAPIALVEFAALAEELAAVTGAVKAIV